MVSLDKLGVFGRGEGLKKNIDLCESLLSRSRQVKAAESYAESLESEYKQVPEMVR